SHHLDAGAECLPGSPLSTGNQDKRHWMKLLTTETALDILIAWLRQSCEGLSLTR
ncbi:hypothetical protein HUSEC_28422, partial [Escherichia coli O104:H4 str. LB226692]